MVTVNIRGVDVMFPFTPYECQLTYMDKVIEAIDMKFDTALESPTGTGKTLSLLCSTLGWLQKQKSSFTPTLQDVTQIASGSASLPILPRIYYCSRTHSQLAQVVRELNRTMYKGIFTTVLGSRDQLCIHDSVCKHSDTRIKASVCRSMISRRTCQYYNKWDRTPSSNLNDIFAENSAVPDIEDMVAIGRKHGICPFFRSRQMEEMAELVLLPYNYIVDPQLRKLHKIDLSGSIVIFDEAHNLENICESVVSTEISSVQIALAIQELKDAIECLQTEIEAKRNEMDNSQAFDSGVMNAEERKRYPFQVSDAALLLSMLFDFEVKIEETFNDSMGRELEGFPGKVFPGDRLLETFESIGISFDKAELFSKILLDISEYLQQETDLKPMSVERGKYLDLLGSFISAVYLSVSKEAALAVTRNKVSGRIDLKSEKIDVNYKRIGRHFKLYLVKEEGTESKPSSTVVKFWCFTSSIAMKALKMNGVRTIIVTSGTLSPLSNFIKNIGLDFGSTLENRHAANSDQVIAAILCKSPITGRVLNGSFQNRHNNAYAAAVAESIVTLATNVPQGVLVFFASYNLMDHLIAKFKDLRCLNQQSKSYWDKMTEAKLVVVEPKQRSQLTQTWCEFNRGVQNEKGAMFFAVCRGKVSEGIDFSDACSRAVCIVGIPYPPLMDVRICLKRLYLNEIRSEDKTSKRRRLVRDRGYRAVNQALGRVLRHAKDFGVVAFLDERFAKLNKCYFPLWIRTSIKVFDDGPELLSTLRNFYAKREMQITQSKTSLVPRNEKGREISGTVRNRTTSVVLNHRERGCVLDYDLYSNPASCLAPISVDDLNKKEPSDVTSLLSVCEDSVPSKSERCLNVCTFDVSVDSESLTTDVPSQPVRKKLKLKRGTVDEHHVGTEGQSTVNVSSLPQGFKEIIQMNVNQYFKTLVTIGKKEEVAAIVMKYAKKEQTFEEMLNSLETELLPSHLEAFLGAYCIIDNEENKQQILQRALRLHFKF